MRSALTARRGLAILVLATTALIVAPTGGMAQESDTPRPCTAVVTPMVSSLRFASDLGLATGPALVPGLIGTGVALPGNAEISGQIQGLLSDALYPQIFEGTSELRAVATELLDLLDDVFSMLASQNAAVDQAIERFATVLEQLAETHGSQIAPADRTLTDLAAGARYFSSGTCRA